ncbi:N-acetylneuraminate synthase family protein [Oleidesulfovibrio alaskensis]|uniref:N-acetylneuraminate synthase family protein n=1 Tax=Oleidesulfovibrio alaskensis TaxID=58180 RepID=UPI0003F8175B|nr:N-acetylneuraminate synthase family protein [Oleidesulfovibrio alaskensis]
MQPYFIAEVSSNHNRDLDRCLAFIETAAGCGCDAVKFQLFRLDDLFAPEVFAAMPQVTGRRAWELPEDYLPVLAQSCRRHGVAFSATPFSLQAVHALQPHVDFYKIASYELLWDALLHACAGTGKPVVLSTGMAALQEVAHAADVLRTAGCRDMTLLHCTSGYPAPPEQCNLAAVETLRRQFGCAAGWSDHTVHAGVIHRAVHRWGAQVVEFHLDLDGDGAEYASGHCWLPHQIAPVISQIRQAFSADGNGVKEPAPCEEQERNWRADPQDGLRPLRAVRAGLEAEHA